MNSIIFFIIPFILLFLFQSCSAYVNTNNFIQDLDGSTSSLASDASAWHVSTQACPGCDPISSFYDSCLPGQRQLFCGPSVMGPSGGSINGQYVERQYPLAVNNNYNVFGITFQLWIFSQTLTTTLNVNDYVDFSFNGVDFDPVSPQYIAPSTICDVSYTISDPTYIYHKNLYVSNVTVFRTFTGGNTATLRLTSKIDEPSAETAFGLRNVSIYLMNTANQGTYNYPCAINYYWSRPTATCIKCHEYCTKCHATAYTQCSGCVYPNYNYGNGTCFESCPPTGPLVAAYYTNLNTCRYKCPGQYYWAYNDSCVTTCDLPYTFTTDSMKVNYCSSPCATNEYLFPNGTCINSCPAPLVKEILAENLKYCIDPCYSQLFLYPDITCSNDCQTPLLTRVESGIKYCFTPCLDENQYLYPNGTCTGCVAPWLKTEPGSIKTCQNPCDPTGNTPYLYPDSSCNSTCLAPLFERKEPGATYCFNPCVESKTFLNVNLQSCQATCPYPSIAKNEKYGQYCTFPCKDQNEYFFMVDKKCQQACEYPYQATESPLPKLCSSSLSAEEIKQTKKMAGAADSANSASSTGNMVWSVISSGDSTSAMMGPLAKMLQYIKFMDIAFPEKVQLMLVEQTKKANKKGWVQKMLGSGFDKFPNHEMNEKFNDHSIRTSFFVNFWPSLFNLSVIFVVTLLVIFAASQTKNSPKIHGILQSLSDILKWNVFLVIFCGTIGDIVLFTSLELQTMKFENGETVFSFILCLAMNVLAVAVVVKILDVNSAIRRSKKKALDEKEFQKTIAREFNSYKAFFDCYKDYSMYQQIFLFVFIIRLVLFNASIGYLYKYPLLQAIISTVANILMLLYLVIKRPMRKIITLVQQIVLELVLLPFNVCVLTLAIMDNQDILEIDRRKSIGNVIFYINVMLPVLSVVLMAAKFIAMAIDIYKTWKMSKLNKSKKFAVKTFRPNDSLNITQEKLRNQPMSFETSQNNNYSTNQMLDFTDHSITISPEINMAKPNLAFESPAYPKIRHSRPQMNNNNNFLSPNHPNFLQHSPFSSHQSTFSQRQEPRVQNPHWIRSTIEPSQMEKNREEIPRRRNRIRKDRKSRFQDDELIW